MESSSVVSCSHHPSSPLAQPGTDSPLATSAAQPSALASLLELAEQLARLDEQGHRLASDVASHRSRLHVLGMAVRHDRDRLAALKKRGNPPEAPTQSAMEEAIARQETEHARLVGELEQTLRKADEARRSALLERSAIERDTAEIVRQLPPHASRIYQRLLDRGVSWPIVRVTSAECGGCAVQVAPQPQDEPWVCPACGRLLTL